jgi:hypothetical protein
MPHFKPPNIKNPDQAFKVASNLQTIRSRSLRHPQSPRSLRPPLNEFLSHPLGLVAYTPSRSPQPTAVSPINSLMLNGSTAH